MFRPTKMQKVRIIVLKSHVEQLITSLHNAGLVDIKRTKIENLSEGRPLPSFDEISQQLVRLRGVISVLETKKTSKTTPKKPELLDQDKALQEAKAITVDHELKELTKQISKLEDDIKTYEQYLAIAKKLKSFKGVDFDMLKTKTLTYRIGEVHSSKLDKLNKNLGKLLSNYTMIPSPNSADITSVLILYRAEDVDIEGVLNDVDFSPITVPPGLTKPHPAISVYHNEIQEMQKKLSSLNQQIRQLAEENYEKINAILYSLNVAAERSEVSSRFSFSDRACVLEGWVKYDDLSSLENSISALGNDAYLETVSPDHKEAPPTVLNNPKQAGPFEFLTSNYSFPSYFELDPTMFYLIFLPILYGMVVGDAVYGFISLGLSYFFMSKFKNSYIMSNVSKLWFYSAFPSIIFGIIFDEWMGTTHFGIMEILNQWGVPMLVSEPLYTGFSRIHNLDALIGITALVGLIHLGVGFIIGAINNWNHHRKHSYAKIAWLGVEIGGTVAVCAMMLGILPASYGVYGIGLLIVSIIALIFTEGIIGVLEVPGLVGNVLSYARIAAIGIVGVILAEDVINAFLLPLPSQGIMAFFLLPIFIVLHIVNAFIAMFEALVQCGRLNLIEFRSKFLEGGGILFKPFALRSKIK